MRHEPDGARTDGLRVGYRDERHEFPRAQPRAQPTGVRCGMGPELGGRMVPDRTEHLHAMVDQER
jgi:hypothetical protein